MPDMRFLNKSCAPRATATPNKPSPAITGPTFIFHISRTATIPKKIIKYFYDEHNSQLSPFSLAHLIFLFANSGSIVNCCVFALGRVLR